MKIVTVLSVKGGAGKTTTAGNLAVAARQDGLSVGLLDLDPQRSASDWWAQRASQDIPLKTASAAALRKTVATERHRGAFDLLMLDTPPTTTEASNVALQVADLVVIPVRPAIFDLRATFGTIELVQECRKPFVIVMNSAPAPRDGIQAPLARETREALAAFAPNLYRGQISQRVAINYASAAGLSVIESEPEGRSAREYIQLWRSVGHRIGLQDVAA